MSKRIPQNPTAVPVVQEIPVDPRFTHLEDIQDRYGQGLVDGEKRGKAWLSLDPGGHFGTRQRSLQEISQRYDPASGKFQFSSNDFGLGITQQDVANYVMNEAHNQRLSSKSYKDQLTAMESDNRGKPNAATPQRLLDKTVADIRRRQELSSQIRGTDLGSKALEERIKQNGGKKLTATQLESLLTESQQNTREAQAGRKSTEASIDNLEQQTQASKDTSTLNTRIQDETEKTGASTRRVNEGNLAINQTVASNNLEQTRADNDWREYVYKDSKAEDEIQRQYDAQREDARFAANAETIRLQNAAEMERYELMLQNDREARQGDSISDLMGALSMLGGAFML